MSYTIGLIGKVSAGKTTLLNYLLGNYYGETSKRKTTHVPSFFSNSNTRDNSIQNINTKIQNVNNETGIAEKALYFNVPIPQLSVNNKNICIVDFPGLDDDEGIEKHFNDHAKDLDIIIFVTDSNSSMNTKSEREVFLNIANKVTTNNQNCKYTKLVVIFNKFDDDEDDELNLNIKTATSIIKEIVKEYNIDVHYFNVSSIKMMVKKTLENDRKSIKLIPDQVLKNVLIQYHGIKKAKAILKKKVINKGDLKEIDVTLDEKKFIKHLQFNSDLTKLSDLYRKEFSKRVNDLVLSKDATLIVKLQNYLDLHYTQINNPIWIINEITKKMEEFLFKDSDNDNNTPILLDTFSDIFMILFKESLCIPSGNKLKLRYNKTPKELIKELLKKTQLDITNTTLIEFASIFNIENFIELSQDTNNLFELINNDDKIKEMLDDTYIEEINQYNDYLLVKQNKSVDTIISQFMYTPDVITRVLINYINHATTEEFLCNHRNISVISPLTSTSDFYTINSKSTTFKILKEHIHKYPVYIKMHLRETQHSLYMDFIKIKQNVSTPLHTKTNKENEIYTAEKNNFEYLSDSESNSESDNDSDNDSISDSLFKDDSNKVKYE